jgi:hypothetical protein
MERFAIQGEPSGYQGSIAVITDSKIKPVGKDFTGIYYKKVNGNKAKSILKNYGKSDDKQMNVYQTFLSVCREKKELNKKFSLTPEKRQELWGILKEKIKTGKVEGSRDGLTKALNSRSLLSQLA